MKLNLSKWTTVTMSLTFAVALALPLVVQAGGGGGGGGGGGFGGGGGGLNPTAARQTLLGRVQQTVPFTDEEWGVVEPRLWKVVGLQTQLGQGNLGQINGLMRAMGGGGRGRGGGGAAQPQVSTSTLYAQIFGQQDLVTTRAQELQVLLDDPNSSGQMIGAKLTEYRQAVTRIKDLLEQARRDLVSVLTIRQEACMLQMGYIE